MPLDRIKGILPKKTHKCQVQMNAETELGGTAWAEKGFGELD